MTKPIATIKWVIEKSPPKGALPPIASSRYYNYNVGNRMTDIRIGSATGTVFESYTYDDNGSLKGISGNRTMTLTWDANNRVKQVGSTTFNYDPADYRIKKVGVTNNNYYLQDEHLEAIYDNTGIVQAKYLRGSVIDEIVNGYQIDATSKLVNYTYHHDALQSVLGQSGHEGSILATQSYSAFGTMLSQTSNSNNALKYTGREIDSETGFYYYRARYYDPVIGRFISEDPKGFEAGVNFYAYANNNPINANDPSGYDANTNPSQNCLNALLVANTNSSALARVNDNWATIQTAADANGISPNLLASIGIRETGFQNIPQSGGGAGAGVFQIDLGQNPSVTQTQAYNIPFAANFAANMLATNMSTLATSYPNFNSNQLLQATAASYNFGAGNISGNPNTIDIGSTGNNYGSNILNLISNCFTPISPASIPTVGSINNVSGNAANGGFVLYPNKSNTNQMQGVYNKH